MTDLVPALPSVDLLPPAERERRKKRSALCGWSLAAGGALLASIGLVGFAWASDTASRNQLRIEQVKTGRLADELEGYRDVSGALAARDSLVAMRSTAMSWDAAWGDLLTVVRDALPAGARVVGFSITSGAARMDGASVGPSGTFTVASEPPADAATLVQAIRSDPRLSFVDVTTVDDADLDGVFLSTIAVHFTSEVYSGRYEEQR